MQSPGNRRDEVKDLQYRLQVKDEFIKELDNFLQKQSEYVRELQSALEQRDELLNEIKGKCAADDSMSSFIDTRLSILAKPKPTPDLERKLKEVRHAHNLLYIPDTLMNAGSVVTKAAWEGKEMLKDAVYSTGSAMFGFLLRGRQRALDQSASKGVRSTSAESRQVSTARQAELLEMLSNPADHEIAVREEYQQLWNDAKEILQLFPVTSHTILSASAEFFETTGGTKADIAERKQKAFFGLFTFYKLWEGSDGDFVSGLEKLVGSYSQSVSRPPPASKASFSPERDKLRLTPNVARGDSFQKWFTLGFESLAREITLNTPEECLVLRRTLVHDSHLMSYYIQNKGVIVLDKYFRDEKIELSADDKSFLVHVYRNSLVIRKLFRSLSNPEGKRLGNASAKSVPECKSKSEKRTYPFDNTVGETRLLGGGIAGATKPKAANSASPTGDDADRRNRIPTRDDTTSRDKTKNNISNNNNKKKKQNNNAGGWNHFPAYFSNSPPPELSSPTSATTPKIVPPPVKASIQQQQGEEEEEEEENTSAAYAAPKSPPSQSEWKRTLLPGSEPISSPNSDQLQQDPFRAMIMERLWDLFSAHTGIDFPDNSCESRCRPFSDPDSG